MLMQDDNDIPALINRAETFLSQQDFASASATYDEVLSMLREREEPTLVRALVGRGWAALGLDDAAAALQAHQSALAAQCRIAPDADAAICTIRRGIGAALLALGRLEDGKQQYKQVLALRRGFPNDLDIAETLNILGETAVRLNEYREAQAYQRDALDVLRGLLPREAPELATALTNLGVSLYRLEEHAEAEVCLREALAIDPNLLLAAENLIYVLYQQGRKTEGRVLAAEKYRRQSFVVQPSPVRPTGTLLVLWSLDGNIPKHHLLARLPLTVVDWHIQYASEAHERQLPPYDLVFNLIGDADQGEAALDAAVAFEQRCTTRLLNQPQKVQQTRRHMIPDLLAGIDDLVIPRVAQFSAAELKNEARLKLLADAGLALPLLLRSAGKHGGETLERITTERMLAQYCADLPEDDVVYATDYNDYKSPDGFYRKYRAIFVEGKVFPYHLAISPHWLVHYFSADMEAHPWKLDEEVAYLKDAAAVLGERAWTVLTAIGQRMGLHYCGADFSLLPDGRVLLFETNATMLVHPEEENGTLSRKNPYINRIFAAFDDLIWRNLPETRRWAQNEGGRGSDSASTA